MVVGGGGGTLMQHMLSIKLKLFHMPCYLKLRQKFKNNNNKTAPLLEFNPRAWRSEGAGGLGGIRGWS